MNSNEKVWPSMMLLGCFLIADVYHFLFVRDFLIPFFANADFNLSNFGTCLQGFTLFGTFLILTWQLTHFTLNNLFSVFLQLGIRVIRK